MTLSLKRVRRCRRSSIEWTQIAILKGATILSRTSVLSKAVVPNKRMIQALPATSINGIIPNKTAAIVEIPGKKQIPIKTAVLIKLTAIKDPMIEQIQSHKATQSRPMAQRISTFFTGGQAKTINNQMVLPLSHGISISGTILTLGAPPITISDTRIHFDSFALVINTSTVPLASGNPTPIIFTIAGHVIAAAPNAIAVACITLIRGASPITVSGTQIHFGSSALAMCTNTVPLVSTTPEPIITTIAGQTVIAALNVVAIPGSILKSSMSRYKN
ncbi:MAG: hypothetical protein ALECFALPRED_005933 [Alectoria fallacina]|uniref:Uncharacterized protein n=1 Tax=Alectoria fallacina TaxID=1903189 RepID=A0A8H3G4D9_9LECA|nr:MAG: hypothetical protein ALECFALPRED_005933 [Alectoria fallacina]